MKFKQSRGEMNELTETQIIEHQGVPLFAVVPYGEYLQLTGKHTIPHEIVRHVVREGISLIKAWREHLGLTQTKVADKMGIKQATLARMEKTNSKPHQATLESLAEAMDLHVDQLKIE